MRITSWNCHYGILVDKMKFLMTACPETDVFVIQECTKIDFDTIKVDPKWKSKNWYSDDLNDEKSQLGVAVFSETCNIEFTDAFNRNYRYVIPYIVTKGNERTVLFAVWTKNGKYYYDQNVKHAISSPEYKSLLSGNVVVIGDYNTGTNDDHKEEYETLTMKLKDYGLINLAKGTEKEFSGTFYGPYNKEVSKNFYINDFCFISTEIHNKGASIDILNDWDPDHAWKGLSDHCPIIVDLNLTSNYNTTKE